MGHEPQLLLVPHIAHYQLSIIYTKFICHKLIYLVQITWSCKGVWPKYHKCYHVTIYKCLLIMFLWHFPKFLILCQIYLNFWRHVRMHFSWHFVLALSITRDVATWVGEGRRQPALDGSDPHSCAADPHSISPLFFLFFFSLFFYIFHFVEFVKNGPWTAVVTGSARRSLPAINNLYKIRRFGSLHS